MRAAYFVAGSCSLRVGDETHRNVFVAVSVSGTPVLNHENEAFVFVSPAEFERYIEPELVAVNRLAVQTAVCGVRPLRV